MPHDVFISHSSRDEATAKTVCSALEARGFVCWIAPRDVRPGKTYAAELIQAITDTKVFVMLHSRASNESQQVHKEVERADAKQVAIVSLRIESCQLTRDLEYFLSSVHWIDATQPPLEAHLGKLGDAVQALLLERGAPPPDVAKHPDETAKAEPGATVVHPMTAPPSRDTTGHSRSRIFGIAAVALAAIALVAVGARRLARTQSEPSVTPATSTTGVTAPGHSIPITGHPPPKTNNPEAAAAYASFLQNVRDGSMALAMKDLERAATLDPSFAAAHLRLGTYLLRREGFAAASQFRAALDERDTALLSFADVYTAEPPDFNEAVARIRRVVNRFPDDPEATFLLGGALDRAGHEEEARAVFRRALALDPQFAGALWGEAGSHESHGDLDGARPLYQRCLDLAPMAASCLRNLAFIHDSRGQCAEVEADARRLVSIEPGGPYAHWWMARALATRGAPVESVRRALDKAAALGSVGLVSGLESVPPRLTEEAVLALLTGDLARAEAEGLELDRAIAESTSEKAHNTVTELLMSIAEERGDRKQELKLAEDFDRNVPAWTPNAPAGVRSWRLYLMHQTGHLADAAFQEQRERLHREGLALLPSTSDFRTDLLWAGIYAAHADTQGEAEDALAHRPSGGLPSLRGLLAFFPGRVHLLAGQTEAAIPMLREAANSCSILPSSDDGTAPTTILFLRAHLLLGQALEQTGDSAGACAAYAKVLAVWGNPKPRSVTVDAAKARVKALRCAAR